MTLLFKKVIMGELFIVGNDGVSKNHRRERNIKISWSGNMKREK